MAEGPRSAALWLRLNGWFLTVAGSAAALTDVLSYRFGIGLWGTLFHGDPLVVTGFEAHVLAVILGVLLLLAARSPAPRWHLAAAAVELTLCTSNLVWFDVFRRTDTVAMGIGVTCLHAIFLVAQLWAWASAPRALEDLAV